MFSILICEKNLLSTILLRLDFFLDSLPYTLILPHIYLYLDLKQMQIELMYQRNLKARICEIILFSSSCNYYRQKMDVYLNS